MIIGVPFYKKLLKLMLKIRVVEECIADEYVKQEIRCPMHLCIGQELAPSLIGLLAKKSDLFYSNHRAHGHYIGKGGNLHAFISELYGLKNGCLQGRGGSMHLFDKNVNFVASTPIVGGTIPVATGHAWAEKLKNTRNLTFVFFGDGCCEEGVVHESFNFASLHNLPIIFVCENNNFSVYTDISKRQPKRPLSDLARGHKIKSLNVKKINYLNSINSIFSSINESRNSGGPLFIEFDSYRWREHCGPFFDDDLNYRNMDEVKKGLRNCSINFLIKYLKKLGHVHDKEINSYITNVKKEFSGILKKVKNEKPALKKIKEYYEQIKV